MHEFRFQGITVIVRAIEGNIDDEDTDGEVMPPHVIGIPLILIYNLPDWIVNCQICQMAHDLHVAIRRRIIAGIFYDELTIEDDIDDEDAVGELMLPQIPLISYSCTAHFDL